MPHEKRGATRDATLSEDDVRAEVIRLSKLSEIAYDRERPEASRRLGLRKPILDNLVTEARTRDLHAGNGLGSLGGEATDNAPMNGTGAPSNPHSHRRSLTGEGAEAEIVRLSKLAPLAYARERTSAAARIGVPVRTLDGLVRTEQRDGEEQCGQGRALNLTSPEPWNKPVGGADLLEEIVAAVRRHVVMPEEAAISMALWVVGAHAFNAFTVFPRAVIVSPEPRCGKTTLLDVISRLAPRPLSAASVTSAAIFRTIDMAQPTMLLDEADTYINEREDIRAIINAGHRSDGCVVRTVGDDFEPRQFSVWAPMVIAGIGKVPSTIEDRAVMVRLRRRRSDEAVERLDLRRTTDLDQLKRKAARWAQDHGGELRDRDPEIPASIFNRAADNWRPLLAVADACCGKWPEVARHVAEGAAAASAGDNASIRVLLLSDIRDVFAAIEGDWISSADLVAELVRIEGRPWAEMGKNGKPMTPHGLARLLKDHGIGPHDKKVTPGKVQKGYRLGQFADAFARYLPARPDSNRYPLPLAQNLGAQGDSESLPSLSGSGSEALENGRNPPKVAGSGLNSSTPPEIDEEDALDWRSET